jgi:hypothetical protein
MPFKVRDLMIDVLPEAGIGGGNINCYLTCLDTPPCCPGTGFRTPPCCAGTYYNTGCWIRSYPCCPGTGFRTPPCCAMTYYNTCGPCSPRPFTGCGPMSPCPRGSIIPPEQGGVATPENLATLKAQLQQALAQVEGQERAMEESQKPQTAEEAEALEQKLVEALEELRQHRDELRRRSAGEDQ